MKYIVLIGMIILLNGCAGGAGSSSVGPHGTDSLLSVFKIETNQNHLNITSRGDVKVGM